MRERVQCTSIHFTVVQPMSRSADGRFKFRPIYSAVLGEMDLQSGWDKTGTDGSGAGTMEKVTTIHFRESEQLLRSHLK